MKESTSQSSETDSRGHQWTQEYTTDVTPYHPKRQQLQLHSPRSSLSSVSFIKLPTVLRTLPQEEDADKEVVAVGLCHDGC